MLSRARWLASADPIVRQLEEGRRSSASSEVECRDVLYADDATMLLTADAGEELREVALSDARPLRRVPTDMSLELGIPKCRNIAFNPCVCCLEEYIASQLPQPPRRGASE